MAADDEKTTGEETASRGVESEAWMHDFLLLDGPISKAVQLTTMFDGNHRVRRPQNLGGGGGSRSRRTVGGGGGARGRPSSFGTTSTVGGGASSITGIPDRKSQLLEQARIQREQRREVARRNGAAKNIQRVYRAWTCRASMVQQQPRGTTSTTVVAENTCSGNRNGSSVGNDGDTTIVQGETDTLRSRYDHLVDDLLGGSVDQQQQRMQAAVVEATSLLSLLLSPTLLPVLVRQQRKLQPDTGGRAVVTDTDIVLGHLVLPYARIVEKFGGMPQQQQQQQQEGGCAFASGRIVRRCLILLQSLAFGPSSSSSPATSPSVAATSLIGLISALLGGADTDAQSQSQSSEALLTTTLCNSTSTSPLEGYGPVLLFLCFRDWFALATSSQKSHLDQKVIFCTAGILLRLSTRAASILSSSGRPESSDKQQQQLPPSQPTGGADAKSILAAALFTSMVNGEAGVKDEWSAEIDHCIGSMFPGNRTVRSGGSGPSGYIALFASLIQALDSKGTDTSSLDAVGDVVRSMVVGKEVTLLSNALDHLAIQIDAQSSLLIVRLLKYVLDERPDLAIVASLSAKGEDVQRTLLNSSGTNIVDLTTNADGDVDDDDDSSSDSDEDMEEQAPQQPMAFAGMAQQGSGVARRAAASTGGNAMAGQKRSRSSRFSRQDLQTTGKLDRLYHTEFGNARREVLSRLKEKSDSSSDANLLIALGARIGSGNIMGLLGVSLFPSVKSESSSIQPGRFVFISVLSRLLQSVTCSKIRNNAASPLLSNLSFNSELLEGLWSFAKGLANGGLGVHSDSQALATVEVMLVFCDLFAHQLMAVDDDEFVARYASNDNNDVVIVADEVVSHVRRCLYDTYWARPVTRKDVLVPSRVERLNLEAIFNCHRLRLLLSGTKLFNSLHERWSRLFRSTPFCDEQAWLFPNLVTKGRDDDAVMVGGISSSNAAHADNDGLSDNESDASPMDVDASSLDGNGGSGGNQEPTAADEENDALASTFSDPKMARVLTAIPQALPFDRRVKMFSSLVSADKARTQDETRAFRQAMMRAMDSDEEWEFTGREQAEIRRDHLYDDSMHQLNKLGRKLRRKVQITMVNKHGQQEAGIDGGGVFKEFLDDLISEAFNPDAGSGEASPRRPLFAVSPTETLAVNFDAGRDQAILSHYEFVGRVLGKSVYESILVEPQFCLPFLNQLLGKQNTLDDLRGLDPEYYRHLNGLRRMSADDIAGLGLSFELTRGGETVELMPGGSSIPVTKSNAIRYVHLVAHRKLNVDSTVQTSAFLRGFRDLIPAAWVRLFSANELQKLISGDDTVKGIDVAGLRAATVYAGGYHPSQPIMQWFWEVVEEFTPSQQRDFLKFMTSCSRQPLLGFQGLVPVPCIQQIRLTVDEEEGGEGGGQQASGENAMISKARLPTSSTCMNLLKLPKYKSKEMLREKLLYAIESGAGFELS